MNTPDNNNVAFRLPEDHLRELSRLAAQHGKSKGVLAKEMVMSALANFSRFDELSHRVSSLERMLKHVAESFDQLGQQPQPAREVAVAVNELRASLATAAFRGLVEFARLESDDAATWIKEAFSVREEER